MTNVVKFARKSVLCRESASRSTICSAQAIWRGSANGGYGAIGVESAEAAERPYSFTSCLASGNSTNPEELLAAAHASCFTLSLALVLQAAGYTPTELSTKAVVTLEPHGAGVRISRSALALRARVPNLDKATFETLAWHAEQRCAISQVAQSTDHPCRHTDLGLARLKALRANRPLSAVASIPKRCEPLKPSKSSRAELQGHVHL